MVSLLVGCHTMTPYEKQARYDEMVDIYTVASKSCRDAGGTMVTRPYTMSRIPRKPTYTEMHSAECIDSTRGF